MDLRARPPENREGRGKGAGRQRRRKRPPPRRDGGRSTQEISPLGLDASPGPPEAQAGQAETQEERCAGEGDGGHAPNGETIIGIIS